jgi:serine O-acetyltransferase
LGPEQLWWASTRLHQRGLVRAARALKLINYIVYRAILPPQAHIEKSVVLGHSGLGVVVHPNVTLGDRVLIWQQVTLAVNSWIGSPHRIVIEDDVEIGAGARVVTPKDTTLVIGRGARVGANAVVTRSVPAGATAVGVPAAIRATP